MTVDFTVQCAPVAAWAETMRPIDFAFILLYFVNS